MDNTQDLQIEIQKLKSDRSIIEVKIKSLQDEVDKLQNERFSSYDAGFSSYDAGFSVITQFFESNKWELNKDESEEDYFTFKKILSDLEIQAIIHLKWPSKMATDKRPLFYCELDVYSSEEGEDLCHMIFSSHTYNGVITSFLSYNLVEENVSFAIKFQKYTLLDTYTSTSDIDVDKVLDMVHYRLDRDMISSIKVKPINLKLFPFSSTTL